MGKQVVYISVDADTSEFDDKIEKLKEKAGELLGLLEKASLLCNKLASPNTGISIDDMGDRFANHRQSAITPNEL